ncbi:MAG: 30S ribosome-binding factor RbfA [Planctomycetes bacterium]|nr:30S ribosome-binding factor RbfA [Planctomycetota bacterium]MCW8135143.1 30S ribosome-binding factor RbfA [Planctomycetota bacterium]
MADPRRIERIQARIRQDIAELFLRELKDPRVKGLISITRVEVSKDLGTARVYWSLLGTPGQRRAAERFIEGAAGFIQKKVAEGLEIRTAPQLTFRYDDSIEKGSEVSKLIDQAIAADTHDDE